MKFGDRLRLLREEKGITQRDLGKIICVSDRVIGYYESNDRFPKDENTLNAIADYFGVSTDYLLGRTNKRVFSTQEFESSSCQNIDITDLPPEAVKQIKDYIDLIKLKYSSNQLQKK